MSSVVDHYNLPVRPSLPYLHAALSTAGRALLVAPPGAGKTTLVPPYMLEQGLVGEKKILLLEPRRIAARNAAYRIASILGEEPGGRVGYRMRGETRVSSKTRIEVVTEGILPGAFRRDPSLADVGLLIFDEFHERSLQADLSLALALSSIDLFDTDLKILVMSATIDPEPIARMLAEATEHDRVPVIESAGRIFPVDTRYRPTDPHRSLEENTAGAIRTVLADEAEGNLLVFLPGRAEIDRTAGLLTDLASDRSIEILPLHGRLSKRDQDRALDPGSSSSRRVVLASAIAESSVTIEGVRIVVDTGLARIPRFDPATGLTRLDTVRAPISSIDQRRGRAGRLGPGICYRLWNPAEEQGLRRDPIPEILEADLLPLLLELLAWGVAPEEMRWLDRPPSGPLSAAIDLARDLGLVTDDDNLTDLGRRVLPLPIHPRLAAMILDAPSTDRPRNAAIAALIEEGDPLRGDPRRRDPDLRSRLDILRQSLRQSTGDRRLSPQVDRNAIRRIEREADRVERMIDSSDDGRPSESIGASLARAYPDRIARQGGGETWRMSNGQDVIVENPGSLVGASFLVVPSVLPHARRRHVQLAVPIDRDEIEEIFADRIRASGDATFDPQTGRVEVTTERRLGSLVLERKREQNPSDEIIVAATLDGIREHGLRMLPWTKKSTALRERLAFLHTHFSDAGWPDVSDEGLMAQLDDWLGPLLARGKGRNRIASLELVSALLALFDWSLHPDLDRLAPERIAVPSGANVRIDYTDPTEPVLPVYLQQMFGSRDTPRIGGGAVPLTLHLLSPARRPVQITRDLAGFWHRTWPEVRKELRGRYPKHEWPEDPG